MAKERRKWWVLVFESENGEKRAYAHFEVKKGYTSEGIPYETAHNIKIYGNKKAIHPKYMYKIKLLEGEDVNLVQEELKELTAEYRIGNSGTIKIYELEDTPVYWEREIKNKKEIYSEYIINKPKTPVEKMVEALEKMYKKKKRDDVA